MLAVSASLFNRPSRMTNFMGRKQDHENVVEQGQRGTRTLMHAQRSDGDP